MADWGEYYLDTRLANFYYNVKLRSGEDLITTDTLFYDLSKSLAHVTGPSRIVSKNSVINTDNGFMIPTTRPRNYINALRSTTMGRTSRQTLSFT